jgi:hypothetical protein
LSIYARVVFPEKRKWHITQCVRGFFRKVSGEEVPYSKPLIEQLRAKYKEALQDLEFLNQSTRVLDEKELRTRFS